MLGGKSVLCCVVLCRVVSASQSSLKVAQKVAHYPCYFCLALVYFILYENICNQPNPIVKTIQDNIMTEVFSKEENQYDCETWEEDDGSDLQWDMGGDENKTDTSVIPNDIPSHIKEIIQRDMTELKLLKFVSNCTVQWRGSARFIVRVWISIADFNLQCEQAIAWGLHEYKYVMFTFSFPPHYWEDNRDNIDIQIHKCMNFEICETKSDPESSVSPMSETSHPAENAFVDSPATHSTENSLVGKIATHSTGNTLVGVIAPHSTLFGWSVAKRMKFDCIKKLPHRFQVPLFKIEDVNEIVEVTGCDWNYAIFTLIRLKNIHDAIASIVMGASGEISGRSDLELNTRDDRDDVDPALFPHNFLMSVICFSRQAILDCYKNCLICGQSLAIVGNLRYAVESCVACRNKNLVWQSMLLTSFALNQVFLMC